jgi:hypothetical protein
MVGAVEPESGSTVFSTLTHFPMAQVVLFRGRGVVDKWRFSACSFNSFLCIVALRFPVWLSSLCGVESSSTDGLGG